MIRIPRTVYEKFLRFALENANPLNSQDWKECIGLVLGRIMENEISVTDIVPIGAGTAVFVDITDYEKVFSLISFSRIEQGEVIVGWAHTHPGLGLFLSGTDIQTQRLYQKMHPKAFALVLDPMKVSKKFSGFNIYRLDEKKPHPITEEYYFDQEFDFLSVLESLTSELYLVPIPLIPATPVISSETEVSWKGINIMISGKTKVLMDQLFQVQVSVNLPFRQFVRLEYQIETDNMIENLFPLELAHSEFIFHETLTSGTLGIYTFRSKMIGTSYIRLKNIYLSDYQQKQQKMPELRLITQIREADSH